MNSQIIRKPLVSIVIALNDLDSFHGGSSSGIKSSLSYFDQFLILYESIKLNWKKNNFDYDIYLLHSIPFSLEKQKILNKLDLNVLLVNYEKHSTKIRPMCYKMPIDCDFRLVLDVDMFAIKEPNFDFSFDALATYGGNKFNKKQWKKICDFLNCEMPKFKVRYFNEGNYNQWMFKEHYLYQMGKFKRKRFPFFNNGAILIKNSISFDFVETWEDYRALYTDFVNKEFSIDIDLEGQDVIGLAINSTTKNWSSFERGFNLIVQERFEEGKKLIKKYKDEVYLIHYINMNGGNKYYSLINEMHKKVKIKYYS